MAGLGSFKDSAESAAGRQGPSPPVSTNIVHRSRTTSYIPHFLEGRRFVVDAGDSSLGGESGWEETVAVFESRGITISIVVLIVANERSSSTTRGLRWRRYERTEERRRRRGDGDYYQGGVIIEKPRFLDMSFADMHTITSISTLEQFSTVCGDTRSR